MKIVTIVGARPQFIKVAPVSAALRARGDAREVLLHTGQHYDGNMSDVFFRELDLRPPDYNLEIGSGSHGAQTGRMLESIEKVLLTEQPDWALIYGDTNSTAAGALAAAKLHIPVAHVEAGLRSWNRQMPEEINRIVAVAISDVLFAPTQTAVENLLREGVAAKHIVQCGDVMYDAALMFGAKAAAESSVLSDQELEPGSYALFTLHRAENTDHPARLRSITTAIAEVAKSLPVVLPLHPRTRAALATLGLSLADVPGVRLLEPVGFLDMIQLERCAAVIVTDSGGVQKEAFFHRRPCVTLRDETEWVELVETGWNRLLPPGDATRMAATILSAVDTAGLEAAPYGDGTAAARIAEALSLRTQPQEDAKLTASQ